ncbi:hypothetical protein BGW42_006834 [Actinomortierella wolfii]|nr:hypothetical protein BGW42_006834 [Actinomortierella wolfii]
MSSIAHVLRSAPSRTRHFTSLQLSTPSKPAFNPEHHPIVLQQLVESLNPQSGTSSVPVHSSAAAGSTVSATSSARQVEGASVSPASVNKTNHEEHAPELLEMQERLGASQIVESLAIPSARPSMETPRVSVDSQHPQNVPQPPKPWWMSKSRTLPIREKVQEILDRRFPSYHTTTPRLYIALPDDPMTTPRQGTDDLQRLQRFRLYFLCECGSGWSRPLGSGLNHVHIGRHGGYAIAADRQEAFFRENGPMILSLLLYLWHGNDDTLAAQNSDTSRFSSQHRRSGSGVPEAIISASLPHKDSEKQGKKKHERSTASPRNLVAALHDIQTIDLPKGIQQDIQVRFRTMIEFLVGLTPEFYHPFQHKPSIQSLSSVATHQKDQSAGVNDTTNHGDTTVPTIATETTSSGNSSTANIMWSYPTSLTDLRRLYGYIGLHDPRVRREHEAIGDLYRVTNLKGDARWICAAHYRWTFYNSEIDSFLQWVVSRGGTVDKQTGAVLMNIVSSDQLVRLCDWIIAKSGAAVIELHLKLQWRFTRKDMWKLARAVAKTNINVLTLNGCMHHEDSAFKILNKRHDPILRMMELSRLQCLEMSYFPSLFQHLSNMRFQAPMIERLVFGPGTTTMDKSGDLTSLASVLASCPNLRELAVPGLIQTESHANRLVDGLVTLSLRQNLSTLDLSRSVLTDGVAYKLAAGLDVTQIQHLNVSYNPLLSDRACARLIDGMRWRLTSLGMAQTGFGDRAMATLVSYLEGSENSNSGTNTNNNTNNNNNNNNNNGNSNNNGTSHPPCPLVSLDIANNQCSQQAFHALARVRRPHHQQHNGHHRPPGLVALDLSMSSNLTDIECSQIVERFVSPELVKLRLGFSNVGDLTAKALANVLLRLPCNTACRLEELELQGNSMTSAGIGSLARALKEVAAWSNLQSLDISHGNKVDDNTALQLLRGLIEAEHPEYGDTTGAAGAAAAVNPLLIVTGPQQQQQDLVSSGFFSVLTELNLSSTKVGDDVARCLARALQQSWVALETLTILEPEGMTDLGMATILEALRLNTTVVELGIGRSGLPHSASGNHNTVLGTVTSPTTATSPGEASVVDPMDEVDLFGTALLRLLEMNKRIRTLTTIAAPMQAIAKGLLLNRTLTSLYLIKTRGTFADLQAMGETIAWNRSLLVLWMGGSEDSLLHPLAMSESSSAGAGIGDGGGAGNNNNADRLGRAWNGDSMLDLGRQHSTSTASSHSHRHKKGAMSITFADIFSKPFRSHRNRGMTFHSGVVGNGNYSHYNTTRKHPYMWGVGGNGGGGGGVMSTVIRNPLFDGIRRNYRLIKVRLDPLPTPLGSPIMSRDASGGMITIPLHRAATTHSLALSRRTTTTHSFPSPKSPGFTQPTPVVTMATGAGEAAAGGAGPLPSSPSPRQPPSQLRRSSISHQSVAVLMDQVQQQERLMQQQLTKKVAANRAALREHGRIGVEELRLLRVDDDIIREVFRWEVIF